MGFVVSKKPMCGGNSGFVVPDYGIRRVSGYSVTLKKPLEIKGIMVYGNEGGVGDSDLPSGYTRLEYIEGTGTQYIKTNFFPRAGKYKIECEIYTTEIPITDTYLRVFGNLPSANTSTTGIYRFQYRGLHPKLGTPAIAACCGGAVGSEVSTDQWEVSAKYKLCVNGINNSYSFNDSIREYAYKKPDYINSSPIYLFRVGVGGTMSSSLKMLSFSVTDENENRVLDFIPAKRVDDGAIGMYDIVNDIFFTDEAGGNFIAGPSVYKLPILIGEKREILIYSTEQLNTVDECLTIDMKSKTAILATSNGETDISAKQDWTQDFTFYEADKLIVTTDTTIEPSNMEIKYIGKRR